MSIINMETESSSPVANKAFFSISVMILLYTESLSNILSDDLQYFILWSGVILLILTIFPVLEGLCRVAVYIFLDRKLKSGSFTYWRTFNETHWEDSLKKWYGNVYLLVGLGLILLKLIYLNADFIDQIPVILSEELTKNIVPIFIFFAMIFIVLKTFYQMKQDGLNIDLTQLFLTLDLLGSSFFEGEDLEKYYLNKAWPLFQTEYINHISGIRDELSSYSDRLKPLRGTFNIFVDIHNSHRSIDRFELEYYPNCQKYPLNQVFSEIEEKGVLIDKFRQYLNKRTFHESAISRFTNNNPIWPEIGSKKRELLDNAIEDVIQYYKENKPLITGIIIDEQMIQSFYTACDLYFSFLEKFDLLLRFYN